VLHADLLNRDVLVAGDGSRLVAVFDWGCSAYDDFLYELAWFTFWVPWHADRVPYWPLRTRAMPAAMVVTRIHPAAMTLM
jgi:aminoglycoside phosphotransferase (APT) family kinase protein